MSNTSKATDFSSIITQVSKDEDTNRSIPLTGTVITSGNSTTTKSILINNIIRNKLFVLFSSVKSKTSFYVSLTLLFNGVKS